MTCFLPNRGAKCLALITWKKKIFLPTRERARSLLSLNKLTYLSRILVFLDSLFERREAVGK